MERRSPRPGSHRRVHRSTTSTGWCSAPTSPICASACGRRPPGPVSDYTGQDVYYRSIQHSGKNPGEKHDRLTIHDYLWRWDTDWFWCSRAFGAQNPTDSAAVAEALPAQQLLLEAHRLRPPLRRRRPQREAATAGLRSNASSRTSRYRSSGHDRVRRVVSGERADRTHLAVSATPARRRGLAALPNCGAHHTYVNIGFWSSVPGERHRRCRPTG